MRRAAGYSLRSLVVLLTLATMAGALWRGETLRRNKAPKALARIEKLGGLHETEGPKTSLIGFYGDAFGDDEFELLAFFSDTESLDLVDSPATDQALDHVAGMLHLQDLHIQYAALQGDGMEYLVDLPRLSQVHLEAAPIDDRVIDHLAAMRSLRVLVVKDCRVTQAGAARLAELRPDIRIEIKGDYDVRRAREAAELARR